MKKLVQIRECDGKCCEESPRWPEGSTCLFLKEGKCLIKSGALALPEQPSPTNPNQSAEKTFQETCVEWPQNSPEGRGTGGCCWQWVDDGE